MMQSSSVKVALCRCESYIGMRTGGRSCRVVWAPKVLRKSLACGCEVEKVAHVAQCPLR